MSPKKKLFILGQFTVRSNKDSLMSGIFLRANRQSNNNNSSKIELCKSSNPVKPSLMAARLIIFYHNVDSFFKGYRGAVVGDMEIS